MPGRGYGSRGQLVHISPSGQVWWSSQMEFSITCNVVKNLTSLPFDQVYTPSAPHPLTSYVDPPLLSVSHPLSPSLSHPHAHLTHSQHTCPFIMGSYSDSDERVRVRWRRDSSDPSLAATALVNWDGACTAEWFPYMLTQGEVTYNYVTSTFTYEPNAHPPLPTIAFPFYACLAFLERRGVFAMCRYATAQVAFVRSPSSWISTYLVPAVLLVAIAYLGFYIDPAAQPARIGLGITSVLVTVINLQSLLRALPATTEQPWLVRFVMTCLMFNVSVRGSHTLAGRFHVLLALCACGISICLVLTRCGMACVAQVAALVEQTMVSYGLQAAKWLKSEMDLMRGAFNWKRFLLQSAHEVSGGDSRPGRTVGTACIPCITVHTVHSPCSIALFF